MYMYVVDIEDVRIRTGEAGGEGGRPIFARRVVFFIFIFGSETKMVLGKRERGVGETAYLGVCVYPSF